MLQVLVPSLTLLIPTQRALTITQAVRDKQTGRQSQVIESNYKCWTYATRRSPHAEDVPFQARLIYL